MPDQDPQNGPSASPKKETVRITLPPKPGDVPLVKRETVRIDVGNKGETMKVELPPSTSPKKESTRIAPLISGSAAGISAPPSAPKAFMPPPSAPKAPGGLPTPPRPSGAPPAAPGLGVKPSLPLKPAPPGAVPIVPAAATPPPPVAPVAPVPLAPPASAFKPSAATEAPVVSKAAPKKETSRISLNPEPKKMPQATVKLQQTQPLAQSPAPMIRSSAATLSSADGGGADSVTFILSCAAAVASLAAVVLAYLAYSA